MIHEFIIAKLILFDCAMAASILGWYVPCIYVSEELHGLEVTFQYTQLSGPLIYLVPTVTLYCSFQCTVRHGGLPVWSRLLNGISRSLEGTWILCSGFSFIDTNIFLLLLVIQLQISEYWSVSPLFDFLNEHPLFDFMIISSSCLLSLV